MVFAESLRTMTNKGKYTVSLSTYLYLIGFLLIFVGLFVFAFTSLPIEYTIITVYALVAMIPAALVTRIILYAQWERKNQKELRIEGNFIVKMYALPKNK